MTDLLRHVIPNCSLSKFFTGIPAAAGPAGSFPAEIPKATGKLALIGQLERIQFLKNNVVGLIYTGSATTIVWGILVPARFKRKTIYLGIIPRVEHASAFFTVTRRNIFQGIQIHVKLTMA